MFFNILLVMIFVSVQCEDGNSTAKTPETITPKPPPNYFRVVHLRNNLQTELKRRVNSLRGIRKVNIHAPPGGSTVEMGEMGLVIQTNVLTAVAVSRIDLMNVNSQTLTFSAEVGLAWQDTNLKWNYTVYPTSNIVLEDVDIWTPKIIPVDVIAYEYVPSSLRQSVTIKQNGFVISKVNAKIEVPCEVEVFNYPFDTHRCHLSFTQMYNPSSRIIFKALSDSTSDVLFNTKNQHREWELVYLNASSEENGEIYHLEIVLKRKAVFYAIVLILPCLVLNFLVFLMFVVDVEGTGRIDLSLNLILSFFVLLIIMVDAIPPSGGEVPLLGLYVTISLVVVLFIMVGSLVQIGLHHKKVQGKPLPRLFYCLSSKCHRNKRNSLAYEVSDNNNSKDSIPLAEAKQKDDQDSQDEEEHKFDTVIFNLNTILLVITIAIHIVLGLTVLVSLVKQ